MGRLRMWVSTIVLGGGATFLWMKLMKSWVIPSDDLIIKRLEGSSRGKVAPVGRWTKVDKKPTSKRTSGKKKLSNDEA